jgi:hypothetical protein
VLSGPQPGLVVPLREGLTLGPHGDVSLHAPGLLPCHARVEPTAQGAHLLDLGGIAGTYLLRDGLLVRLSAQPLPLREGDGIILGEPDGARPARPMLVYECQSTTWRS